MLRQKWDIDNYGLVRNTNVITIKERVKCVLHETRVARKVTRGYEHGHSTGKHTHTEWKLSKVKLVCERPQTFLSIYLCQPVFFSCLCVHTLVWSDLWRLMALWAKLDFVLGKSKEHSLPRGRTSVRVLSLATGLHASMCSLSVCACISWGC